MSTPPLGHYVAYNVGTHITVCSCGCYFQTDPFGIEVGSNSVQKWARHLHETRSSDGD